MLRRIVSLLTACLLLAVLCVPVAAAPDTTPLKAFEYELQAGQTVILKKYIGQNKNVIVPAQYQIDGVSHSVYLDAKTVFRANEAIESVTLKPDTRFVNNTMATLFAECSNLRSVVAKNINTGGVTSLEYLFCNSPKLERADVSGWDTSAVVTLHAAFSGCKALSELKGYTTWNTAAVEEMHFMFNEVRKLKKIELSRWDLSNLKNCGWCFQNCAAQQILLPGNIPILSAGVMNHATNVEDVSFTIPEGVQTIGYAHTFYDFATNDFREFGVAEGNTKFKTIDGVLYTADGKKLLAIPRGKTFPDDTYEIPETVTFLAELSFSRNYNIKQVILPNGYLLAEIPQYAPEYITYNDIGNLNAGLNLNVAIYLYTGVEKYAVREDNPNYTSRDGVIYSKDMTTLLAVPTRYRGKLNIPEGVQVWRSDAMWYGDKTVNCLMEHTTQVSIPASMTDIAADQLYKLNWLRENVSGFRITVHKDNPVYYVDKKGQLAQRTDIAQLDVQLENQVYTYDGAAKTPRVTIRYDGKILTPEKDYSVEYFDNTQAGTARIRITAHSLFYGVLERSFTIEKAVPDYTVPTSLTATYGQFLKDISLPEGFSWEKPLDTAGDAGSNQWMLRYDMGNANYQAVEEIPVTLTVHPKEVNISPDKKPALALWTGSPLMPALTLYDGKTVIPASEYTLSYEKNTGFGYATVTVTDNPGGNYTVSGTQRFLIVPGPLLVYLPLLTILTLVAFCQNISRKRAAQSGKPSQTP